jgi:C1A family cysteine protease
VANSNKKSRPAKHPMERAYKAQHRYNVIPSIPDHRDVMYSVPMHMELPPEAALPNLPPVRDQGQEGSCTGFSLSIARALVDINKGPNDGAVFSAAFIYYHERLIEGTVDQDSGAMIRDGLSVMHKLGVCTEGTFPYKVGAYTVAPPDNAVEEAKKYTITQYAALPNLQSMKAAILHQQPIVFGIAVYPSFEQVGSDGLVPMPLSNEGPLGGHAIAGVAYKDDTFVPGGGRITLMNSWGPGAGDKGFYYVPYAYLMDPRYTFDAWTIL